MPNQTDYNYIIVFSDTFVNNFQSDMIKSVQEG